MNSKKIALVLSGGGARGLAHIGVIEELVLRGYTITSISGTSMGALVGAMFATGHLEDFKNLVINIDKVHLLKLLDISFKQPGLIKGEKAFNLLKKFIGDIKIEDLSIPFSAVAVDLVKNEEVVFTKGNLLDALRASVAIPTVFAPVKKGDAILVDSGVLNNVPVEHVSRTKGDLLVAVEVNYHKPIPKLFVSPIKKLESSKSYKTKVGVFRKTFKKAHPERTSKKLSYFNVLNLTLSSLIGAVSRSHLNVNPPDILITISRESSGLFDFYKAKELIELGRYEANKVLDDFEKNNSKK